MIEPALNPVFALETTAVEPLHSSDEVSRFLGAGMHHRMNHSYARSNMIRNQKHKHREHMYHHHGGDEGGDAGAGKHHAPQHKKRLA